MWLRLPPGKSKKNQSCSKWHEMARKLVENNFLICSPTPQRKEKKIGYVKHFLPNMKKIKVVQNCMEWRENWLKTIFWKTNSVCKTFVAKHEKNQNCSKLHGMARKLVILDIQIRISGHIIHLNQDIWSSQTFKSGHLVILDI